ncbi:MAG: hypothetical protein RQM92_03025 [Candidatus Syntrophopropionicum ammoniitolerans]
MAQTISIGSTQLIDLLKVKMDRELELFENDGLKVDLEENPAGKFTFLAFRVSNNGVSSGTSRKRRIPLNITLQISFLILF